jgi:hypothetical protein
VTEAVTEVTSDAVTAAVGLAVDQALAVVVVLGGASLLGDVIHALLHRWTRARLPPLRALAALHAAHHAFYDDALRIHPARFARSAALHHLPEAGMRVLLCLLCAATLDRDALVVVVAAIVVVAVDLALVLLRRGLDPWHRARPPLVAPRGVVVVDAAYHALHHAFPDHFLAAHVQVLDRLLGTMLPLRRRRVLLTGSTGFVAALQRALEDEGAVVVRVDPDALVADGDDRELAAADVVVLGHGAQARGATAYEALLARAARAHGQRPLPLEVWTIGADDAWRARAPLLVHERVFFRRLERSPAWGAAVTLALLRRGARRL